MNIIDGMLNSVDFSRFTPALYLVIGLIIILLLKSLSGGLTGRRKGSYELRNYMLAPTIMTKAEMAFYNALVCAIADEYRIMVKVRLADIILVKKNGSHYMAHFGKIKAKHVDYLLCDPVNLKPILVIELDDKSHQRSDRISRDNFVDSVFKSVGLPILRHPVKRAYNHNELLISISNTICKQD